MFIYSPQRLNYSANFNEIGVNRFPIIVQVTYMLYNMQSGYSFKLFLVIISLIVLFHLTSLPRLKGTLIYIRSLEIFQANHTSHTLKSFSHLDLYLRKQAFKHSRPRLRHSCTNRATPSHKVKDLSRSSLYSQDGGNLPQVRAPLLSTPPSSGRPTPFEKFRAFLNYCPPLVRGHKMFVLTFVFITQFFVVKVSLKNAPKIYLAI